MGGRLGGGFWGGFAEGMRGMGRDIVTTMQANEELELKKDYINIAKTKLTFEKIKSDIDAAQHEMSKKDWEYRNELVPVDDITGRLKKQGIDDDTINHLVGTAAASGLIQEDKDGRVAVRREDQFKVAQNLYNPEFYRQVTQTKIKSLEASLATETDPFKQKQMADTIKELRLGDNRLAEVEKMKFEEKKLAEGTRLKEKEIEAKKGETAAKIAEHNATIRYLNAKTEAGKPDTIGMQEFKAWNTGLQKRMDKLLDTPEYMSADDEMRKGMEDREYSSYVRLFGGKPEIKRLGGVAVSAPEQVAPPPAQQTAQRAAKPGAATVSEIPKSTRETKTLTAYEYPGNWHGAPVSGAPDEEFVPSELPESKTAFGKKAFNIIPETSFAARAGLPNDNKKKIRVTVQKKRPDLNAFYTK